MNTKFKIALIFVFFLASTSAFAQYGYPYGYGSNPGVDRSIGRVPKPARAKDKDKSKKELDIVEVTVQYLQKRLKLDDFQAAVITEIYNEHKAEILAISAEDAPITVLKKKMREVTEKIDAKILPLLGKEQVAEYQKMIAERKE